MRILNIDIVIAVLIISVIAALTYVCITHNLKTHNIKTSENKEAEVVIEQACVNGYEWVVLFDADGKSIALEQVYKASEVPGACAQPVECQDL